MENRTPCSECENFVWINLFSERTPVPGCVTGEREVDEIQREMKLDLECGRDTCEDFKERRD